jgi:hypothetical protein
VKSADNHAILMMFIGIYQYLDVGKFAHSLLQKVLFKLLPRMRSQSGVLQFLLYLLDLSVYLIQLIMNGLAELINQLFLKLFLLAE